MSIVLRSRRGAIGTAWHAVALRRSIETILGVNRAAGGKADARAGRVQWLDIAPGTARADVLDELGELRSARLDMAPLRGADRELLLGITRASPALPARMMAGEYPREIEAALAEHEVSLLPAAASDVWHDCSCLDWPGPCRHVAALAYVLVEAVEEHPVHLLTLRGVTLEEISAPDPERASGAAPSKAPDGTAGGDTSERQEAGSAAGAPFDPRSADAGLLQAVLGTPAASVLARLYGCEPPAGMEPGRSDEGG